ncbi:MAG: LytTR family DNA-binding domain-containing protein [Lachnospiraceae bacterium]|nr:LytTR family DNA-binding domain-containing protein [Lachnospiraceae bacterium]
MRIAIVDDEKKWIEEINEFLSEYDKDKKYEKDSFTSGEDFLQSVNRYDVVLMDIEMPDMNGFDVLKEYTGGAICIILTTHTEFSRQGYHVNAFRYVDKLRLGEELKEAFDSVGEILEKNKKITLSVIGKGTVGVPIKRIMYIETVDRNINVHTDIDVYKCSNKISELWEKLEKQGFITPNRSYIINIDYIKGFDRKNKSVIIMKNEAVIVSSRRRSKTVVNEYLEWKMKMSSR